MSLCLPFLMFQGDAQKALNHYLEAFPDAELKDLVLHPEGTQIYAPEAPSATAGDQGPSAVVAETAPDAAVEADAELDLDSATTADQYAEETLAEVESDVLGNAQPVAEAVAEELETTDEEPAAYAGDGEIGPDPSEDSEDPDAVIEERMDEAQRTLSHSGEMLPEQGEETQAQTSPRPATSSSDARIAELSAEDLEDLQRQSGNDDAAAAQEAPQPLVATAQLFLGGQTLMIQDSLVRQDFTFTPAISIAVLVDSEEEFSHVTETLAFGGEYLMEPGSYDFAKNFAWVKDQFGVTWQINQPLNGAQDPDSAAYAAPAQAPDWS